MIIEHLIAKGCSRIAHIGGYRRTRIFNNRIKGYIDAIKKYDLPLEEALLTESALTLEDGREKMKALLDLPEKPDGVYIASDYAALGALQIIKEKGLRVPEDIRLVGFGNEPFTALVTPSITSVNQHSAQIGEAAASTFLNLVEQDELQQSLNKIILSAELVERNSSK